MGGVSFFSGQNADHNLKPGMSKQPCKSLCVANSIFAWDAFDLHTHFKNTVQNLIVELWVLRFLMCLMGPGFSARPILES
jgi:hypothetical protein